MVSAPAKPESRERRVVLTPAMPESREWRVVSRRGRERVVSGFAGEIRKKFADANFKYKICRRQIFPQLLTDLKLNVL